MQGGDTLQSIASSVYGDAGLWYKIAEANGLSAGANLIDGAVLSLPAGVVRNTHNASTNRPFNPAEAIGDLSPTTPQPTDSNKCGVFGQIILAAVAVAVTFITKGATTKFFGSLFGATQGVTNAASIAAGFAGGATSAAAGSAVSQGIGVATGIQDKFSFNQVGLAAISGGLGGGQTAAFGSPSDFVRAGLRAARTNALTQGIGVATGLQNKFSFAGVAGAAVGAGVGSELGSRFGEALGESLGGFGANLALNTASGIANAATRSALTGNSFGDELRAAIPDIIGQAVGGAIANRVGPQLTANERAQAIHGPGAAVLAQVGEPTVPTEAAEIINIIDANDLSETEYLIALRERIEARAPDILAAGGEQAEAFREFQEIFNASLLSADVYNPASNPELVPTGFNRLSREQATTLIPGLTLEDSASGYFAAIYENSSNGELFFVNRGTDTDIIFGNDTRFGNLPQATGFIGEQYNIAIQNAGAIGRAQNRLSSPITFAGHSLGGGLAQIQALAIGANAIVFNPAEVSQATVDFARTSFDRGAELIRSFVVAGEALSFVNNNTDIRDNSGFPSNSTFAIAQGLDLELITKSTRRTLPAVRRSPLSGNGGDLSFEQRARLSAIPGYRFPAETINRHETVSVIDSIVADFDRRYPDAL
ncbi:MAG: hypothetical protein AAGA08_16640 [Pseudomonadota bacterium]